MANICCSIEMEPKTLNHGKLHQAREVAADVLQKLEPSEASVLFIDGLQTLISTKEKTVEEEREEEEESIEDSKEKAHNYLGSICQCSYASTTVSPDQLQQLPQPLSAPF